MARAMPDLSGTFEGKVTQALDLANKVEAARGSLIGSRERALLHPERIEMIYEMAFFRCYLAWEEFLEQSFVRYVAGYVSPRYSPSPVSLPCRTLRAAWAAYLGNKTYKLWHDPNIVVSRAAGFLVASPHEIVINSALGDLVNYAAVRHRIAHAQENAKIKFDAACVALIGHQVKGSKAGKLLRQPTPNISGAPVNPGHRWLHEIAGEYVLLSKQIA